MPGQDFKFIRSCNGTHQNPLIQTILLQFFRKGFQLGVGVGMKANVGGEEGAQLADWNVTKLRLRFRYRHLKYLLIRRIAGLLLR